ncbi:1-acyl-sn-glycerol-3-phosphate acyltransferase isoform X1 [Ricinus communis]|uniref:1-acyl-sn-glycerol-3-phosphate acyltransferase isoform X1 n=1 Tax=Ricinus communis TaxID=3988 RepID=UPI00201B2530|nr:1-acyl-sn-glycerol-3-phosphate acyltransferase isoform X1 [Ricinus communis]XP_015577136.2 1-acyl-sn-glycerol-3-phosphate acyltransferase isoform X1 [Ricinus communis]XP_015577137.2 1-acyl-sn-glycerol-3-phosphate acyltransferase isoform X1 [Ricinus communis]XP_048234729.1 1-acyl-sn-glycerol-3-phosphate acyltransferase isoform X1 [Ricinus communis]
MESTGGGSFMRNRRLESFLNTDSSTNVNETSRKLVRKEVEQRPNNDVYVDDDGWISGLISWVRIVVCFVSMMITTFIWASLMLLLLPWPYERIRQGNIYGHVTGRILMWILGNPLKIEGVEFSNEKAIYISNHSSPIDIFLIMWLTPTGTVGVAKKEIIWYPLFGQLYVLANHLRIDRSNPAAAIQSMKEAQTFFSQVACAVIKNNLSLIIFPEGTRSKSGRLLPFKKGFVHLALQTRLPIVPIVLTGTHRAWRKDSLHVRPAPINVKYLRPIKTDNWTDDKIDDYVKLLHDTYVENLPESQRPLS